MRALLTLLLFGLLSTSVSAETFDECMAATDGLWRASCVQRAKESERAWQVEQAQLNRQVQIESARMQAMGLAAFGSGNAMMHGMNQGMQSMQVHPYQLPPAQHYSTR